MVEVLGPQHVEVDGQAARARRRAPATRARPGAHECTHGSAPASVIAASTHSSAAEASGGSTRRCRPKPEAVGTAPAEHRGQRRLVDLHDQPLGAGQPAAQVGDVVADPLGERLGEVAAGAVVGEDLVAARLLDGRGQRPRAGRPGP